MAILAKVQKWYEGKSEKLKGGEGVCNNPPPLLRERVKVRFSAQRSEEQLRYSTCGFRAFALPFLCSYIARNLTIKDV